mmetsp:Transcript_3293/g.3829  ORF Transcript_3293/g.3829 Transcript_3293/m.3829 type:complete len:454 (-) Transcript_3293:2-1363(-)
MVHQLKLRGHKSQVLSLAHSSTTISNHQLNQKKKNISSQRHDKPLCHLISGDSSGTTRVWDLRCHSYRASHCILAPNNVVSGVKEVTAVGFHPLFDNYPKNEIYNDDASNIEASCPFTVYTAVGSKVFGYDLRQTKSPSIISQYDFHIAPIDGGEEINAIDIFHDSKHKKTFLATADDDGLLRVTDSLGNKKASDVSSPSSISQRCSTYQHSEDSTSPALVTSAAFRPRSIKTLDVATAGTDCTINLWDINRPHNKPSSTLHIRSDDSDNMNQICNPPIVHSLSWSSSGRLLAAGLGDGSCLIASIDGRSLVESYRLRGGHDSAVASVLFPRFGSSTSLSWSHITAQDRLIITAGNDGSILLWDLGSVVAGDNAVSPSSMFTGCGDTGCNEEMLSAFQDLSVTQQEPKILFGIPHGKKSNWIVSSSAEEQNLSSSLFVADTSNDITVYVLPRQ